MDYVSMTKIIRKFTNVKIDLRKKLTPSQKGTITRYFNIIKEKGQRGFVFVKESIAKKLSKKNIKKWNKNNPKLKSIFVQMKEGDKITTIKGNIVISSSFFTYVIWPVDNLLSNPKDIDDMAHKFNEMTGPGFTTGYLFELWGNFLHYGTDDYDITIEKLYSMAMEYDDTTNILKTIKAKKYVG